jgi:MoxR-like ATPase
VAQEIQQWAHTVIESVESVFFGKRSVIEKLLVALLCRGHALLEDVPGLGKTILARALAGAISGDFSRIQCTPDLLPADILGVSVYNQKEGTFTFREGPITANVVLVDEINRATPRTQAALLEAMAENQISVEGKQKPLPEPFFLLATENPIEFEGTFPLPEAQKDRFFLSLGIGYPERDIEARIVESQRRTTHPVEDITPVTDLDSVLSLQQQVVEVFVHQDVLGYIQDIIQAGREHQSVRIGGSPRATLALYKSAQALARIRGRDYVIPEDVKEMAPAVLSQRVLLKAEYEVKGIKPRMIIEDILNHTQVPMLKDVQ